MIAGAMVPLFVGAQFQEVTEAIPLASILAGAARKLPHSLRRAGLPVA